MVLCSGDLENWKVEDPPFNEEWIQAEVNGRIVSAAVAKPDQDAMKYLHVRFISEKSKK